MPVVKPELVLTKKYNATDYPLYDNYPAINVNKYSDIPNDYKGAMGVPVTFLAKHNTGRYKILDLLMNPIVGGKKIYKRITIQHNDN